MRHWDGEKWVGAKGVEPCQKQKTTETDLYVCSEAAGCTFECKEKEPHALHQNCHYSYRAYQYLCRKYTYCIPVPKELTDER